MIAPIEIEEVPDLVDRLCRVLAHVDADAHSSDALKGAVTRFTALEQRRRIRKGLGEAREKKDEIIARVAFLAEMDDITERESDYSVFAEMSLLFKEIADAATDAMAALRDIQMLYGTRVNDSRS